MAYTIPVAALVLDAIAAATALNLAPDFFEDRDNDRWEAIEDLSKLTGAPISSFSDEEGDIFYIGIQISSDWYIRIDAALLAQEAKLKAKYGHPLVQAGHLAVVSEFC